MINLYKYVTNNVSKMDELTCAKCMKKFDTKRNLRIHMTDNYQCIITSVINYSISPNVIIQITFTGKNIEDLHNNILEYVKKSVNTSINTSVKTINNVNNVNIDNILDGEFEECEKYDNDSDSENKEPPKDIPNKKTQRL